MPFESDESDDPDSLITDSEAPCTSRLLVLPLLVTAASVPGLRCRGSC